MFSICHVVIIVSENIDLHFWKFIRTVEMLKYRIPNIASPNLSLSSDHDENSEYYPDIVFAFTKQEDHNFSPITIKALKKSLEKFFNKSRLQKEELVGMDRIEKKEGRKKNKVGINLFMIPMKSHSHLHTIYTNPYPVVIDHFRSSILAMKKSPFLSSHPMSEKDWARNAGKVWEIISKSSFIADYSRTLNKMRI